jgi:predicted Ser/Thr protein kinase
VTTHRSQAAAPDVRVGEYRLLHRLGEGGMGVVHLAEGPDGRRVALKVLRPHVVGDEEARDRLAREVKSLSRVRSPRVAEIIDADPWGPIPFVATRYVPGLCLHDHVPQEGPLSGEDLVWFARALAEALQAVHQVGVLHRDIKPSNVLMEGRSPVLIDFGLARVADDTRLTRTGWLLGTPGYLAPEILYGHEPTVAADVHSWAATVAFAGTGRPPFGRGPSVAVMDRVRRGEHDLSGLDSEVRSVVEHALDPRPEGRPDLRAVIGSLGGDLTRVRPIAGPDESATGYYSDLAGLEGGTLQFEAPTRPTMAPSNEPYQAPPPPLPTPRVSIGERLRRWMLGLALLAVVVAGVMAAPYAATVVVAGSAALLRWLSVAGSSVSARRQLRGRKWYDVVVTAVSAPVDLVASIPGTVLLLCTSGLLVASAALVCLAADAPKVEGLAGLGALLGLTAWFAPGGRRVRSPLQRVALPVARAPWFWLVAMVCLGAATAGLLWGVHDSGTSWSPADGAPWDPGTWLGRHL